MHRRWIRDKSDKHEYLYIYISTREGLYNQLRFGNAMYTYLQLLRGGGRAEEKKRFNFGARGWIYQSSFRNMTLSIARTSTIRSVCGSLNK